MPYMLNPANYTQTMRPNLYNMAYRRVGAYKGMGRLHPSNYLEIGTRPNMIGNTAGQFNTLSGQLSLNPPSLRGLGAMPVWNFQQRRWVRAPGGLSAPMDWRRHFWRRGLGQPTMSTDEILGLPTQSIMDTPNSPFMSVLQTTPQSINPTTGAVNWNTPTTDPITSDPNFPLYLAGGAVLLLLLMDKRR